MNPLLPENPYLVASAIGSTEPFIEVYESRDPNPNDTNYTIQRRWLNTSTFMEFILLSFTSYGGLLQAVWVPLGGISNLRFGVPFGSSPVTGDTTGLLKFTSNDASIVITGTNGGLGNQSINFATSGTTNAVQQITLDDGIITPAGTPKNVTITGVTVNNASNAKPLFLNQVTSSTAQIEIQVASQQASGNVNKAGIASFDSTDFIVDSTTGFVQLATSAATATLTGNSGVATASTGNIDVIGSGNINTSGSGDTLTVTLSGTTNHAVQVGNASGSITSVVVPNQPYAVLLSAGTNPSTTDPAFAFSINTFNAAFTNFNGSYTSQTGRWFRVGRMVFVQINMDWMGNTAPGDMTISNMPFQFGASLSHYPGSVIITNVALPASTIQVMADGMNATTILSIVSVKDNASPAAVQMNAAGTLSVTITYCTV